MKKVMYLVMALMLSVVVSCKEDDTKSVETNVTEEVVLEATDTVYVDGENYTIQGETVLYEGGVWYIESEDLRVQVELVDGEWVEVDTDVELND